MCQRAFTPNVQVLAVRQLSGGTFNETFLITLAEQQVILRVAPPMTDLLWNERWLMRREQAIQPFFAAIAPLMPRILMADFTHQLIDRDYVFQTYLSGERWDVIAEHFTTAETVQLWEQFGGITKTIHQTVGTTFGGPYPEPEFPRWSQAIFHRFEAATQALVDARMDVSKLRLIAEIARSQTAQLDAIQHAHLLHGDLWLFNILVAQQSNGPRIVGILDADRAWWGDPLADWTMFVLAKTATPETEPFYAHFWKGYGQIEQSPGTAFRKAIYEAMNIGAALAWANQQGDADTVQRGMRDLRAIAKLLPTL